MGEVCEVVSERNNILDLIEEKSVKMQKMETEMLEHQRQIEKNNKLIEVLELYTKRMKDAVA